MKKLGYLIIFLLLAYFVTASQTVNEGDILTYGNLEVKILGISQSNIKVSIDNVTNIVSVGKSKEINGATIEVIGITYFDSEMSTAVVEVTLKPFCGDNTCNNGETSSNCCTDCGCNDDHNCEENKCIPEVKLPEDECSKNEDCDDNNESTIDICSKRKSGTNRKCLNYLDIICETDIDCDDQNQCTVDRCVNNDCTFSNVEDCEDEELIEERNITELEEPILEDINVVEGEKTEEAKEKGFFEKLFGWLFNLFT